MNKSTLDTLKSDICKRLEYYEKSGINSSNDLLEVKTALSAYGKILTIETMESLHGNSYSRAYCDDGRDKGNSYRRDHYYNDERDGYSRHLINDKMQNMLRNAEPREREIIEAFLRKL